jgi:hypothetical protein
MSCGASHHRISPKKGFMLSWLANIKPKSTLARQVS